jgi:tRNA-dihydrouridine synthase
MVGRGIFGNPWFFNRKIKIEKVSVEDRLRVMIEHAKLFARELNGVKNYDVLKKHYSVYAKGFDGAKELRADLMKTRSVREAEKIVTKFVSHIEKPPEE